MFRLFDIFFSLLGLIFLFPVFIVVFFIGYFDTGSPLFVQKRLGKSKKPFYLIKFRSMKINTLSVSSHLVSPDSITIFGSFLRKTKIDELPQLWNVLIGEMSLVGPRPNLPNQTELIEARILQNVFSVRPGITGLAQINNIDMSRPEKLAEIDSIMIKNMTIKTYFAFIFKTVIGSGYGDAVK